MSTIGSLAIKIAANSEGLTKDLEKITRDFTRFGTVMGTPFTALSKTVQAVQAPIQGLLGTIRSAANQIPLIGGSLGTLFGGGDGFSGNIKNQISQIGELGREAARFGITTQSLAAIQTAAGSHSEAFTVGLNHLSKLLGEVSAGSEEATKTFGMMGLSGSQLAKLPLDQALVKIAQHIQTLPTAFEKTTVAMELMGRGGAESLTELSKLAGGLEQFGNKSARFGSAVTSSDVESIRQAARAMGDIDAAVNGVFRQVSIQLAPVITSLANSLLDVADNGKTMGENVTNAAESVAHTTAYVVDTFADLKGWIDKASISGSKFAGVLGVVAPGLATFFEVVGLIKGNAAEINSALENGVANRGARNAVEDYFSNFRKHAAEAAKAAADVGKPLRGLADFGKDFKIAEFAKELDAQITNFGKGADEMRIFKLEAEGATKSQLAGLRLLAQEKSILENMKSLSGHTVSPGAAEAGSQEAVRIIANAANQHKQDPNAKIEAILKEQQRRQEQTAADVAAIRRHFERVGRAPPL